MDLLGNVMAQLMEEEYTERSFSRVLFRKHFPPISRHDAIDVQLDPAGTARMEVTPEQVSLGSALYCTTCFWTSVRKLKYQDLIQSSKVH